MPSPLGHALAGLAAGWAVLPRDIGDQVRARHAVVQRRTRPAVAWTLLICVVSLLPDLDLLIGAHSQWSHSVGAVVFVLGLSYLVLGRRLRLAAAIAAAFATHPILDWLGQDGTPPYGVMAAWPFSERYFHSGFDLFMGISRRYWLPGFVSHNLSAIARELAVLGPLAVAVWMARRR